MKAETNSRRRPVRRFVRGASAVIAGSFVLGIGMVLCVGGCTVAPSRPNPGMTLGVGSGSLMALDGGMLPVQQVAPPFNTEAYDAIRDNPFLAVPQNPLSTFAIDVDTASFSNVRRYLESGSRPPRDAVRIEELVNYFSYEYAAPAAEDPRPFAVHFEAAAAPWAPDHRLVRIGIKGREVAPAERPPANLVFLLDVSGSMMAANKLPLVQRSLRLLVEQLAPTDHVAIVVYAGASGLVLPRTPASEREKILAAIDRLEAGGSTNGGAGIQLAYDVAAEHFLPGGINRVILATDGDFNVGVTNRGDLDRLIRTQAARGVFLTVLGFGYGNIKDATLEQLADRGNGVYAYVDTLQEARRILVEQGTSTLLTIAKDVKIQVEFNPARVQAYRLIGYENRLLRDEDFNNDLVDAGEIGAGHTVTALYEIVPAGAPWRAEATVDPLRYQPAAASPGDTIAAAHADEWLTVKIRHKAPEGETSELATYVLRDAGGAFDAASADFRFAAAVAGFGMMLRDSPYKGTARWADIVAWADAAILAHGSRGSSDRYRAEFVDLVRLAEDLVGVEAHLAHAER